jgi:hypothetical protein
MSFSPFDGWMNPNPLESLKNLTVPSAIGIDLIFLKTKCR